MSVDSQLINRDRLQGKKEEKQATHDIKKNKINSKAQDPHKKEGETGEEQEPNKEKKSIRQKLLEASQKDNKKSKISQKIETVEKMPSKRFLRWSWITLFITGGISIILSLFYLNLHLLFRAILPRFFCKFGQEWVPPGHSANDPLSQTATKGLGIIEILTLILIDIVILVVLYLIIVVITSWLMVIYAFFGWFVDFFV